MSVDDKRNKQAWDDIDRFNSNRKGAELQTQSLARERGDTAYVVDTLGQRYKLVQVFNHDEQKYFFVLEFVR